MPPWHFAPIADLLIDVAGSGRVRHVDWPPDRERIEIGSVHIDSTRFAERVGWHPRVTLREGLARTVSFYRAHLERYVATVEDLSAP